MHEVKKVFYFLFLLLVSIFILLAFNACSENSNENKDENNFDTEEYIVSPSASTEKIDNNKNFNINVQSYDLNEVKIDRTLFNSKNSSSKYSDGFYTYKNPNANGRIIDWYLITNIDEYIYFNDVLYQSPEDHNELSDDVISIIDEEFSNNDGECMLMVLIDEENGQTLDISSLSRTGDNIQLKGTEYDNSCSDIDNIGKASWNSIDISYDKINGFTSMNANITNTNTINTRHLTVDKPVIYLYPNDESLINVNINNSNIYCSYPECIDNSWSIQVNHDGVINDMNDKEYPYLYWEGSCNPNTSFESGFCVSKENSIEFLEFICNHYKLNSKESTDFITYWLPKLLENNYNIVNFQNPTWSLTTDYDFDSKIELYMVFKGSDSFVELNEQELPIIERNDSCIVEWGGTYVTI